MLESRQEKSNKRVLILANYDVGLYQFRRELIGRLLALGYEVFLSLPKGDLVAPLVEMGCHFVDTPVDRRGINPKTDLALFRHYRQILKDIKPRLVITYTIKPNVYGGLSCRQAKIPYAANITGLGTAFQKPGPLRSFVTGLYKSALKGAQVIFFENSENLRLFQKWQICRQEQCRLLNGAGVNLERFSFQDYPAGDVTRFLFVGRIMKEKGVNELFAAMERLRAEGKNCVLDMLGDLEEDYSENIAQHTKEGWLHYYGSQADVRPFIEKAHCFVLPSWHEGMANTNLECAAMGRPLITSDIPGCREAVLPGESGLLCRSRDEDSLYHTMKDFLSLSPEKRAQMGLAGRRHMEAVFDKKAVVAETLRNLNL